MIGLTIDIDETQGLDLKALDNMETKKSDIGNDRKPDPARFGKFTASTVHQIMTGCDDTLDQKAEKIANSFKRKSELIKHASRMGITIDKKDTMLGIGYKLVPYRTGQLSSGAKTYIRNKVIEDLTGEPISEFTTFDTEYGKQMEGETVAYIEKLKGIKIHEALDDQVFHTTTPATTNGLKLAGHIGATPDGKYYPTDSNGSINKNIVFGFEGKAPKRETHWDYLFGWHTKSGTQTPPLTFETMKQKVPNYYWQAIMGLYVTGWHGWTWVSYCPKFTIEALKSVCFDIKTVDIWEDIKKMEKYLLMAVDYKQGIMNGIINGKSNNKI